VLTAEQKSRQSHFRAFARDEIMPHADHFDREERIPTELIEKLARAGYLGAIVPEAFGGAGMDMISLGLLNEEIGRGCSSVRSLLTVHNMVVYALLKWGSRQQKLSWLPKLAMGETLAAFALSEPEAGSDATGVLTTAERSKEFFVLNGQKKWISFGQIADVFLVFAKCGEKLSAFLVERNRPGLSLKPIRGMLGTRASMLAELHMSDCMIPEENEVGRQGFGLVNVATTALDLGRYSVAWGCVGIGQACLDASIKYANERKQFGKRLGDHQLIRQILTNMITGVKAARLLCYEAGLTKETGDPDTVMETCIAKYFAATMCLQAASDAVQIHGANGCSGDYPVQRYFRDAKIMEIIEGSTQIQQLIISECGFQQDLR
jgi:glutaryl-CoA dehydrogenase (non-decarboxylating)